MNTKTNKKTWPHGKCHGCTFCLCHSTGNQDFKARYQFLWTVRKKCSNFQISILYNLKSREKNVDVAWSMTKIS